jgi:hypothetical protein
MHTEIGGREELNQKVIAKQLSHAKYVRSMMICLVETNCAKYYCQNIIIDRGYNDHNEKDIDNLPSTLSNSKMPNQNLSNAKTNRLYYTTK